VVVGYKSQIKRTSEIRTSKEWEIYVHVIHQSSSPGGPDHLFTCYHGL
jgi:hypothetical protein